MTLEPASYPRHRFPAEIISHAVWLYHVFSLSLRDVELILAERGIVVTHESIRHWCLKFGSEFARKLRRRRPQPGDTWHLDEVFIRIRGVLHYLWRAVDQHGVVLCQCRLNIPQKCRLKIPHFVTHQSRPKPRGGSISARTSRSSSMMAWRASAVALSRRLLGRASHQAAYSACKASSSATASCHR